MKTKGPLGNSFGIKSFQGFTMYMLGPDQNHRAGERERERKKKNERWKTKMTTHSAKSRWQEITCWILRQDTPDETSQPWPQKSVVALYQWSNVHNFAINFENYVKEGRCFSFSYFWARQSHNLKKTTIDDFEKKLLEVIFRFIWVVFTKKTSHKEM